MNIQELYVSAQGDREFREIADALDEFYGVLKEYVYYDKQIIDRLEKMDRLIRSVSIIQDTD